MSEKEIYIKVTKDGPYIVYGIKEIFSKIILTDDMGVSIEYGEGKSFEINFESVALCRCGRSKNAPYCDNSHQDCSFDGSETASFKPILEGAQKIEGPNLTLYDNEKYCAFARFCDAKGSVWNLVYMGEKETDELTIKGANLCPAGRLVVFDNEGNMVEDELEKSITILEDDGLKLSGPLWVRGGIRIESLEGKNYEIRNRQTLCRCGASKNKPFCDSSHAYIKFKAEYKKE